MYSKKQLVVFQVNYSCARGWGAVSNFITKYIENMPMDLSDVQGVTSCAFTDGWYRDNFEVVKLIKKSDARFLKINRPENIHVNKEHYNCIVCIRIDYIELYDVVELQNLYLIWDTCRTMNIVVLISGRDNEYYKTSHYFEFLTATKNRFYESVFFHTAKDNKLKHLQIRNIGVLEKFLPLFPINSDSESQLRQVVHQSISFETLEEVLNGRKSLSVPRIMQGALRGLLKGRKYFENCEPANCARKLSKLNVLTFLLFCFSVGKQEKAFENIEKFSEMLYWISQWADGCLQLMENIIFHSPEKRGAFSFRILEADTIYLKEKYGDISGEKQWIELVISDYPGRYQAENIAETFRGNLKDSKQKEAFKNLQPTDFFIAGEDNSMQLAWKNYYAEYSNIINHYGLKIFCNIVNQSGGFFMMQSFSGHTPKKGEYCCSGRIRNYKAAKSMPGTSYSMIYPMKLLELNSHFEDYGIEEQDRNKGNVNEAFLYDVSYLKLNIKSVPTTAEEKTGNIERLAEILLSSGKEESLKQIWAVNVKGVQGNDAEVIYKAVILAILQSEKAVHVVLYECGSGFVEMLLDVAYHVWDNLVDKIALSFKNTQVALYTEQFYEEILIIPGDWPGTLSVNRIGNFSRETRWKDYFEKWTHLNENSKSGIEHIPFDVLVEIDGSGTIFEHYVQTVVKRNIQGKELGCKLENTHMRLGSTIHVNHFYEAEVLFGNALFVERFAFLLLKKLRKGTGESRVLQSDRNITLYGYTNYSEQVIFRTMQLLKESIPGIDVDYAILERETENRGFVHVDQIRYSRFFKSREEQKDYFRSREIICIIPIASTLKTNEKLINLFCEENGKECQRNFLYNIELILVGSEKENQYWKKSGKKIIGNEGMEIFPIPEFFVEVELEYLEPLDCELCFPCMLIDEIPLIEVNVASTIPNQAFGIIAAKKEYVLTTEKIKKEEAEIGILKDSMLYRHLERGENHFLFYCQTNLLLLYCQKEIQKWLEGIRDKVQLSGEDFVVLFCPSHFSNAGFIEYVNSIVFRGAAVVLRDDVDKEYRCNFKTKYSNLRGFVEKLSIYNCQNVKKKKQFRFFFIDDAIISGRTFQRSKSLVQSIIGEYPYSERQKYNVFDGVFVLLDRNSRSSRWQYVGVDEDRQHFFAFRTLHISSIRNHGDACILCNLENESKILKESAVIRGMSDYWKKEEEKFSPRPVGKYLQEEKIKYERESSKEHALREMKKERAFRRLICMNNADVFLNDEYHGNNKKETLKLMIMLVLKGCEIQEENDRWEYFLSYCKVLSRPFRVFDRAVKEAVFDFLLILSQGVVSGKTLEEIIDKSDKKKYLKDGEIKTLFAKVEKFVSLHFAKSKERQDLVLVLLKQLTELKSNFIIRVEVMNLLADYAESLEKSERTAFYENYQRLVKKLLGISSDTSKSVWFDQVLFHKREKTGEALVKMPQDIVERLYLENARVYQDAYKKINDRFSDDDVIWAKYFYHGARDISEMELIEFGAGIEPYIKLYQFKDFITIMDQYGYYKDKLLTDKGKILVAANVFLYRYIISEFEEELSNYQGQEEERILDKCNYIATYMHYILASRKTIIIMEVDAEYDTWENILIERYNRLSENICETIQLKSKREYIILGSSEHNKASDEVRDRDVVNCMQQFCGNEKCKKQGYVCDFEQNILLWELGQDAGHPVYVYSEWEGSECEGNINRLNRIRNVMQYYWKMNERVFNRSNNGFFHELVATGKKLLIHSRYKAHSHTKSDIRLKQFEHVNYMEKYSSYYQSDLLMLLADLNVSDHYRNSLTKDYYVGQIPVAAASWNSLISIYREKRKFYVINSDGMNPVEVSLSYEVLFDSDTPLSKDEKILCFDYTNAEREPFLLLYSLIVNAATNNRGLVEDNNSVTVWLSKTSQNQLRIANVIGENMKDSDPESINARLKMPPVDERDGISLWSMSRYVKKIISSILENRIRQTERLIQTEKEKMVPELRSMLCLLLGEGFETRVERESVNGIEYFSVLVPILEEKYKDFFKEKRR